MSLRAFFSEAISTIRTQNTRLLRQKTPRNDSDLTFSTVSSELTGVTETAIANFRHNLKKLFLSRKLAEHKCQVQFNELVSQSLLPLLQTGCSHENPRLQSGAVQF